MTMSVYSIFTYGPEYPKGVIDVTIKLGYRTDSIWGDNPSLWAVSGPKFSTNMSAVSKSDSSICRPVVDSISSVIPRLLVFRYKNGMLFSG